MWRLSIAALARIREDKPRLARAVTEGMKLQVMAQAPLLVGFGWTALWVLPLLSGKDWAPVMQVYPFIALGFLVNAVFNLHTSALYVLQKNYEVAVFHAIHIAIFAGGAFILVPSVGLVGYGLAEAAALTSYVAIHAYFVRDVGNPSYLIAGSWAAAAALALFVHELGWWAALGTLAVLLWPGTWREIRGYVRTMLSNKEAREA